MNHAEAVAMVEAARANDVFLMEAFMYRCHPQIARVVQLIQEGAIGEVLVIRATFSFRSNFNPQSRLYNREMGGGGILDIGCYTASIARKLAGAVDGKPFLNPVEVKGNGKVGPTGVDHIAVANLKFENGIIAEIVCAVECSLGSSVHIYGSEGIITIPTPWVPSSPCRGAREPLPPDTAFPSTQLIVESYQNRESYEITVNVDRDLFSYEADMVANHIEERQAPAMPWADTLGNMDLLDDWLNQVWGA
jgi:predicted dehydrogenase